MERRLKIFEQLKSSKLTKLTLKQNNQTVSLNLKEDLLNENVILNDKVLLMLESIAKKEYEKNSKLERTPSIDSVNKFEENSTIQHEIPTKKLKIDEEKVIQDCLNKIIETIEIRSIETSIHAQEEVQTIVTEKINIEQFAQPKLKSQNLSFSQTKSQASDTKEEIHLCRICCLNSISEKALHDHITRVHGGSEFRKKHASLIDDDTSDNEFDTQHQQTYPKPNVAIRVAKVAYYDSKVNSNSNLNFLKSNVFTTGMRGNFFSQERLPLRSCKIKLELNGDKNHDIVSKEKISKFFKSLLSYIPFSIKTINDLLIQNDLNEEKSSLVRAIHKIILESKEQGISLYNLKHKSKIQSMNLINEILQLLIKENFVLSVGVVERVYVAHEFCQPWVISSLKCIKGRSQSQLQTDESSFLNENLEKEASMEIRPRRSTLFNRPLSVEDEQKLKNYKKVQLIPRPWRYIDGLLNRKVLQKMLESILLHLKTNPSSSFESISQHYCPVLQPIMTLELLEILEYFDCLSVTRLKREEECTLTSEFDGDSEYVLNKDDLNGNELQIYDCNEESLFIIKQIFS